MPRRVQPALAVLFLAVVPFLLGSTREPAYAQPSGECTLVNVTVTATLSSDPGFEGLYRYTVSGTWDVARLGLGHLDIFVALDNCACKCDARTFRFAPVAGTSSGLNSNGLCTVGYDGSYVCRGDPSIPPELGAPTVKFDAASPNCDPMTVGNGTWVFYSLFPPAPFTVQPGGVAIKHGNGTCTGPLSGQLPTCDCTVPARPATWGGMKAIYR